MNPAFAQTDHRPWPLPPGKPAWRQVWLDLAFIHFEVEAAELRRHIPAALEIDTFDGKAWIGLVPFRMEGVTRIGLPAPSLLCNFPEFNVRTYVKCGGKPGVWFFSLDVPNLLAVWFARQFFHLPYFRADMKFARSGDEFHYAVRRGHRRFTARYRGHEAVVAEPGTFGHWATERYCLYAQSRAGVTYRGEVQHPRWPLQRAAVAIEENSFTDFRLGRQHPEVWFSPRVDVVVWPLERVSARE